MNTKSFEEKIEALGQRAESGVRGWVRNDTAFNFLRSTPARIVLALLTVGVLYGVPAWQMFNRGVSIWLYAGALVGCVLLQKLSVRFAFDDDSEIDEYQQQRRNRAYRRAYKRVATILAIAISVFAADGFYLKHTLGTGFKYSFDFGTENWLFVGVFAIGLFVLQKYLSWGIKGESWADRTRQ
ncbi:MAG: hypothetical protein RLZZ443_824 [Actinomycetota bacterium]|jgi:hypothetical protein